LIPKGKPAMGAKARFGFDSKTMLELKAYQPASFWGVMGNPSGRRDI
jgi:hypothetical protein